MNIISINETIKKKKQAKNMRELDIQASYICIEQCLQYLEMNDLPEIKDLKDKMKESMKELSKLSK